MFLLYPSKYAIAGTGESLDAGGGSGGSMWVEVETLNGDGLIDVEGGAGANDGGGGGAGGKGRHLLHYQSLHG